MSVPMQVGKVLGNSADRQQLIEDEDKPAIEMR